MKRAIIALWPVITIMAVQLDAKKPKTADPRLSQVKTIFVKGGNEAAVSAREKLEERTCYHLAPSEAKADAVLELDWAVRGGKVSGTLTAKDGDVISSGVSSRERRLITICGYWPSGRRS
jgi:hypothetical protein